jgi:hypothetical protein
MQLPMILLVFGIVNIIVSLLFIFVSFTPFLWIIFFGQATDRELYGFYDWFSQVILPRITLPTFFVFSFLLFISGIALLKIKSYGRKLTIVSLSILIAIAIIWWGDTYINISLYHNTTLNNTLPWGAILVIFLFYSVLQIICLEGDGIKEFFNDGKIKLSFKKPVFIILLSAIFSSILQLLIFLLNSLIDIIPK